VSLLVVHRIGALIVTEADGSLAGIISERDIVWSLRHGPESMRAPVASIMTTDVRVADLATTCDRLMRSMSDERVRHLPIVADGHVVGMVSIGDVVCALLGDRSPGV
jgi:CBS domain-containing protein